MSGVQSIERAFALLRALAVGSAGVTDLAERADRAGVEVALHVEPDEIHVFPYYQFINPRGRDALGRIADWLSHRI